MPVLRAVPLLALALVLVLVLPFAPRAGCASNDSTCRSPVRS
jgi:hypothetical protein